MPKIKLNENTQKSQRSWMDNLQKLFEFRISRLRIGDALISDDGNWRVDCLRDIENQDKSYFVVSYMGKKLVERKKANTIIKFLVRSKADRTMTNHENSAIFLLSGFYRFTTSGIPRVEIELGAEYDIVALVDECFWDEYLQAKQIALNNGNSVLRWKTAANDLPEISILLCFSDQPIDNLDDF